MDRPVGARPQYGRGVGPTAALLLAVTASSPANKPAPPTPVTVSAGGEVLVGSVAGTERQRYRLVPDQKGTLIISVDRIHGPAPRAVLRNAEGKGLRRADRRGKLWARPAPGTELILELAPPQGGARAVYHLSVAFDVDRPRAERGQQRPARPRDIVRVPAVEVQGLDQVHVGGLPAEYTIHGGDVLVGIPAFAQSGPIELHFESRPAALHPVELIGKEAPRADLDTGACAARDGAVPAGCLRLALEPSVGSRWLDAIARVLDADLVKHSVRSGVVELKLRLPSSESYALEQLKGMPGVRSAKAADVELR